jgi:hypothetical protein
MGPVWWNHAGLNLGAGLHRTPAQWDANWDATPNIDKGGVYPWAQQIYNPNSPWNTESPRVVEWNRQEERTELLKEWGPEAFRKYVKSEVREGNLPGIFAKQTAVEGLNKALPNVLKEFRLDEPADRRYDGKNKYFRYDPMTDEVFGTHLAHRMDSRLRDVDEWAENALRGGRNADMVQRMRKASHRRRELAKKIKEAPT